MRRLRQFLELGGAQRVLFLQSVALMPLVRPLLRLAGFRRINGSLARRGSAAGVPSRADEAWARMASAMVDIAARHGLWRGSCLDRSLLLAWLLARRGIAFELQIGVMREVEVFKAHAWVECGASVLGNRDDVAEVYLPLVSKRSAAGSK